MLQPEQPVGIHSYAGSEYYVIKLSSDQILSSDFNTNSPAKQIIVHDLYGQTTTSIYYSTIVEGGWLMYTGNRQGHIIYFPTDCPEYQIQFSYIPILNNDYNYMTYEEILVYLPWFEKYVFDC